MCLILDTNKYGDFLNRNPDMKPVRDWVENKRGKIAYSATQKMESELKRCGKKMEDIIILYRKNNYIKNIPEEGVEKAMGKLQKSDLKSDDPHIIALAQVSGVKLLVSGDTDLHKDFKRLIKGGSVYQTKEHKHLLKRDLCP